MTDAAKYWKELAARQTTHIDEYLARIVALEAERHRYKAALNDISDQMIIGTLSREELIKIACKALKEAG